MFEEEEDPQQPDVSDSTSLASREIGDIYSLSDSTPEQAADNINKSKARGLSPTTYRDLKADPLSGFTDNDKPENTHPVVVDRMIQSEEHASAMQNDVGHFNAMRDIVSHTLDTIRGKDVARDLSNLRYRQLSGETLTNEEEFNVVLYNARLDALNKQREKYGLGTFASLPGEVTAMFYDFGRATVQQAPILGSAIGIGAVTGAARGIPGGPAGIGAGAATGIITGGLLGFEAAQIVDLYQQSAGTLYNEIHVSPGDTPLPDDQARVLAKGGALLIAGAGLAVGRMVPKNVPWVNRLMNGKAFAKFVTSAQGQTIRELGIALGKSATVTGSVTGIQTAIGIITQEMAKTYDGNEASFYKAMQNSADRLDEIAEGVLKGAAAGAAFTGVARIIKPGSKGAPVPPRSGTPDGGPTVMNEPPPSSPRGKPGAGQVIDITPSSNLPIVVKGTQAIQLQTALEHVSKVTSETVAAKHLPDDMDAIRQQTFKDAGVSHINIDKDELNKWADSEKKAEAARKLLGTKELAEAVVNSPIRLESYKFSRLVDQFPEVAALAKPSPDGISAQRFRELVDEAEKKRKEIKTESDTGLLPEGTPVQQREIRTIDEQITGEESYLEQPTFTEDMNKVLPKSEILRVNAAQTIVRAQMADEIKGAAKDKPDEITLNTAKTKAAGRLMRKELEKTIRLKSFEEMVDEDVYTDEMLKLRAEAAKAARTEPGIFDVTSVQHELTKLIDREKDIQSRTGDDAIKAIKAADEADSKWEKVTLEEIEKSALAKAYEDISKLHLKELKVIVNKHYGAFKSGVKRMALPIVLSKDLQIRARTHIGKLRVMDLNVKQWEVGERKSQRNSIDAVLKNQLELAAREKENAAYNIQLAKQTVIAMTRVQRAYAWIAALKTPKAQAVLGVSSTYLNAVNELLDVYNFDPSLKNQHKVDAYSKFVDKMISEGKGDFAIPPEVQKWLDVRKHAQELTVDQTLYLYDKMKNIFHQAKLHNRLLSDFSKDQLTATNETIAAATEKILVKHPQYDESKSVKPTVKLPDTINLATYIRSGDLFDLFNNIQFIAKELDQGVNAGFFAEMIYQPLAGTGKHEGPYGSAAEVKLHAEIFKAWEKGVKEYGKRIKYLGVESVFVPEFSNIAELNYGKLKKVDLLGMIRHLGNEDNIEALTNYKVKGPDGNMVQALSVETIKAVIERHMTQKDVDLIQHHEWDMYKKLAPRLVAVHKVTTGLDLELVKPKPFKLFGKDYEGGYAPIEYSDASTSENIARIHQELLELADPNNDVKPVPFSAFEGIVRSPHTKERKGSNRTVALDFEAIGRGFQNVVHDITMRVPVRDVVGYLKNKSNRKHIASVIGHDRYMTLLNHVVSQTNSLSAQGMLYSENQKKFQSMIQNVEQSIGIVHIAYNIGSVVMTLSGVPQALGEMGVVSGKKHLSKVAAKFAYAATHDWKLFNKMIDLANEIDPSLKKSREGLGEFTTNPLSKIEPKKRANMLTYYVGKAREAMVTVAFEKILGTSDNIMKTMVALAAYEQYVAGEAPGHPLEKIVAMEPRDLDLAAKGYAAQINASTLMTAMDLEKAAIQKTPYLKSTARYWNEARGALNSRFQDTRDIRNSNTKMVEAMKRGDILEAVAHSRDANDTSVRMIYIAVLTYMVSQLARLKNPVISEEEEQEGTELTGSETIKNLPSFLLRQVTTGEGVGNVLSHTYGAPMPIVRDLVFGAKTDQNPSIPVVSALNDFAQTGMTAVQVLDLMSQDFSLLEAMEELTPKQRRHLYNAVAVSVGGLPVNGIMKFDKMINGESDEGLVDAERLKRLIGYVRGMVTENKPTKEQIFEQLLKAEKGETVAAEPPLVEAAKEAIGSLETGEPGHGLTSDDIEIIKHAESRGQWDARPTLGGAYGLYQFIPDTWGWIMQTPEGRAAQLTEEGRIYKNPKQQNIAMTILTNYNARWLRQMRVPVDIVSVYFAHHFGTYFAKEVFLGKDTAKLSKGPNGLLTDKVLKNNPQLRNVKTVGGMKRYLKAALERGRRSFEKQEELEQEFNLILDDLD